MLIFSNKPSNNYKIVKLLDLKTGQFYSLKEIKLFIQNVYIKLGISKKAKATDFIPPHKCFGYFKGIDDAAWVERDVEECPIKDSYYYWRQNLVSLVKETFKAK